MNFFDGRKEAVRFERGQTFGIPARVYGCLAQCAISCSELANIEPQLLELLLRFEVCLHSDHHVRGHSSGGIFGFV
jgi:hypothetical protein